MHSAVSWRRPRPTARCGLNPLTAPLRRGYTSGMKTAVSIPDDIFERAERFALQGRRSRSEVYAAALDEYLARRAHDEVTDAMNRACGEIGGTDGAFLAAAGRRVLAETEW